MSLEVHGPYISLEIAALTFPRASFAVLRLWCNQNGVDLQMATALVLFSTLDMAHTSASLTVDTFLTIDVAILRLTAGIIPHGSFLPTFSSAVLDAEEGFATAS